MPDYGTAEPRRRLGLSIFGWFVFIMLFAGLILVGWKTAKYYGMIKRGEIVYLPQFRGQLSTTKKPVISRDSVERSVIEVADEPAIGADAATAKLTIVEFADFECPFSKQASSGIRSLVARYGDKVRVIYRDYPLEDIHTHAKQAALAAQCAGEQNKFWAYHDKIYLSSSLASADLLSYASEIGLDEKQFEKCFVEERYKDKVEADTKLAQTLGVSGTPAFFFNGQKVEGAIPDDQLDKIVQRMIQ